MEEKKLSDQKESTASDNAEAVNLSTLDNEDKLKKLSSFSGTIEIPLPIGRQDEKQQENLSFSKFDDISADEFKDFEDLLWGGNMLDAPVLNFGDEYVVTEGETLEDALIREIGEEVGLKIQKFKFNASQYFPLSNNLICNFITVAESEKVILNNEVDYARWYSIEEAKDAILHHGLAEDFLLESLNKLQTV